MLLFRCQTFWHLHCAVLFSGMEFNVHLVSKCALRFSLSRQTWTTWWGRLGFPHQGEEAVCQCSAYTPNVITCERDKEGQVFPIKLISHCKVLFPFNHFQGELLPWSLLSRWVGSSEVRPPSDACWFVFSHPFSCWERSGVKSCHFVPLQPHPKQSSPELFYSQSRNLCLGLCLSSSSPCTPPPSPSPHSTNIYRYLG